MDIKIDAPLIGTKLTVPRLKKNLVTRHHLIDRLNSNLGGRDGFNRKLTLLSAPAGYGKSTLAIQWVSELSFPVAWLTLDENDNELARFVSYLGAAVATFDNRFKRSLDGFNPSQQRPALVEVVTILVNEIASLGKPCILVLDDLQFITNQEIIDFIHLLIDYQPPNLHLGIVSREDPHLPISRLRANGELLEIRQVDLSFGIDEVGKLMKSDVGLDLSEEEVRILTKRTEGWAVGLQMAAISMAQAADVGEFIKSFSGSNRFILDYLFDEVLCRLEPEIQQFLLHTSILDSMCCSLCERVTGTEQCHEILAYIERANLFIIPQDEGGVWYRYHALFRDLLSHRLRITNQEVENSLHLRASEWFDLNGYPLQAIQHAIRAEDWERSSKLLISESDQMLRNGEVATLLGLFSRLPETEIVSYPELCLVYVWPLVLIGQLEKAESLLMKIESRPDPSSDFLGRVAAAHAYIARSRGETEATIRYSQQALKNLPADDNSTRGILEINLGIACWHNGQLSDSEEAFLSSIPQVRMSHNQYAEITSSFFLARIKAARGKLQEAYQDYLPLLEINAEIPILALAFLDVGVLQYEWNHLDRFEYFVQRSIELSKKTRAGEFQIGGHTQFARALLIQNKKGEAIRELNKIDHLMQEFQVGPQTIARNAALHAELALSEGDLTGANKWMEKAGSHANAHNFYPFLGLVQAKVLIAEGNLKQARLYLEGCIKMAEQNGWEYGKLAAQLQLVTIMESSFAACELLKLIILQSEPQSFIQSFVKTGVPLLPLIQEVARQGVAPEYAGKIMQAIDQNSGISIVNDSLVEPLSDREMEVLNLVAAGMTNRQIADHMIVSVGTVKTHVHHIYGKLEVLNRAQAIRRARELHLL